MEVISITVSADKLPLVGKALNQVAADCRDRILYLALNRTGDMTFTQLKRMLAERSGRKPAYVADHIETKVAYRDKLSYEMFVRDYYAKITSTTFSARAAGKAVSHEAWGGKLAQRAFMIVGTAFKRPERGVIKPLYGPNVAREVERAAKDVDKLLQDEAKDVYIPRVLHEVDRSLQRVKGQYGL